MSINQEKEVIKTLRDLLYYILRWVCEMKAIKFDVEFFYTIINITFLFYTLKFIFSFFIFLPPRAFCQLFLVYLLLHDCATL